MPPLKPGAKPTDSGAVMALYGAAVLQAAEDGTVLMNKLIAAARLGLHTQEAEARNLAERDAFAQAAQSLRQYERQLGRGYPAALLKVFSAAEGGARKPAAAMAGVHFDQLELMNDAQVQCAVTLARVRNETNEACGVALADLQRLVNTLQGLQNAPPTATALRADSYIQALQEVVEKTQVSPAIQAVWYQAMGAHLGPELKALYSGLSAQLRQAGLVASDRKVGASGVQTPAPQAGMAASDPATVRHAARAADTRGQAPVLLTLDRLRQLLSGELAQTNPGNRVQQFAAQFSEAFEDPEHAPDSERMDFPSTVPAALEALAEMDQVEHVVRSLEQRRRGTPAPGAPGTEAVEARRHALRSKATGVAQALSIEVVSLMVDNLAQDAGLLAPVREVFRDMESSLQRLVLEDPRFFADKQHPARQLLQAIAQQSLAFESEEATGFAAFLQELQSHLAPLHQADACHAQGFTERLEALQQCWTQSTHATLREREAAVEALRHAEARSVLAEEIADGIDALPEAAKVPAVVLDFLCGPWAQVIAQARIKLGAGSEAAQQFEALVPELLWSAHPELARANPAKLTRLVPRLLATLREGLASIQYPAPLSGAFFESLMAIHEKVFRRSVRSPASATASTPTTPPPPAPAVAPAPSRGVEPAPAAAPGAPAHERLRLLDDGEPWMAPEEVAASNFVALEGDSVAAPAQDEAVDMPLGSWVELWHNGQWVRTQLTWASPHATLYLFTGVFGATQSMSRKLRDKLLAQGKMRLLSDHAFVDGALDAVAQAAVRNSADTTF